MTENKASNQSDTDLLQSLLVPFTASGAVSYLQKSLEILNFHEVYRYFFPAEYAITCPSWDTALENENESDGWAWKLYNLVDEKLFPLPPIESLYRFEDEYFDSIPIYPEIPDWFNSEMAQLPITYQIIVLLGLISTLNDDESYVNESHPVIKSEFLPLLKADFCERLNKKDLNFDTLNSLCQQNGEMCSLFPEALLIFDHDTDNPWLAATDESFPEFDWTIKNLELLTVTWKEAKEYYDRLEALDKWFLSNCQNIKLIIDIWERSHESPETLPLAELDWN